MVGIHSKYEMQKAWEMQNVREVAMGREMTIDERIMALKYDLAELEGRAAKLKQTDVRTSAETAADNAMHQIWTRWCAYFLPISSGAGLSMGDQRAFHEIAQPVLRKLAVGEVNVRMKGALVAARDKLVCYRSRRSEYIGGMEYTALMRTIDEALAS